MESRRRCLLYVIVVFAFSSVCYYLVLSGKGGFGAVVLPLMWCPALAGILTSLMTKKSIKSFGWKPWPPKYLGFGYFFPLLYATPAYVIIWATKLGGFPDPEGLERARKIMHLPNASAAITTLLMFAFIAMIGVPLNLIGATGEEIGWRGFFVPELTKWLGFKKAALVSGVVWALWHFPLILWGPYSEPDTPRLYQAGCFFVMVVTIGVAFAWVRMKSGSLWPAAIFHASHNAFIQAFFDRTTINTGKTHYFTGEFGAMMLPFMFLVAWYCWKHSADLDNPKLQTSATSA